jgi:hypothetical protein
MSETYSLQEWHRKQAVDNFNQTWDLIDRQKRTGDEDLLMIHKAHASRYHWGETGGPKEMATGEWQISRVYALVGMPESALYHGKASLGFCQSAGLSAFDHAFAFEAIARAYHLLKDSALREDYIEKATAQAGKIESQEDHDYCLSEIKSIR